MNQKINNICIFPDGNRTFSILNGSKTKEEINKVAYLEGARAMFELQQWCFDDFDIPVLFIALTSRKNHILRSDTLQGIVDGMTNIIEEKWLNYYIKQKVRVTFLGDRDLLEIQKNGDQAVESIKRIEEKTREFSGKRLYFMIAYDATYEMGKLVKESENEKKEDIMIDHYGHDIPDVDFIIRWWRPRLSGGVPIIIGEAADIYFVSSPFPAFKKETLKKIIEDYKTRIESKGGGYRHTNKDIQMLLSLKEELLENKVHIIGSKLEKGWIPR